jgi:outer membrane protein OmpU
LKSKKNKRHIRLTALALTAGSAAAPTSVWAQSSVVLYGILDAGITYVNNAGGSRQLKFDDGISYGNRIGFKGTEDLWGGVKAIFVLESGIKLGTGKLAQGGAEFGRQAYVGLQSQWGTLSAGDQLDLTNVIVEGYNISSFGSGYAIHQGDFDRMNGDRLPNSVKYMSPDFGGLSFGGLYSFGNIAGNFHEQSAYSIVLLCHKKCYVYYNKDTVTSGLE